jgi:hypothetical protein
VADLRRLELALGALCLTVVVLGLIVALDAVLHHLATPLHLDAHSAFVIALATVEGVVIVRATRSLTRQLRSQRAFLRALPVREPAPGLRVFPGQDPAAFCAGLLRPAVYVSEGTLRKVGETELAAILAHEEHHRARRDPLRLLLARTLSDALRPLPPFAALAERLAAVADLEADAATVEKLGDVTALAAALVRFDELGAGVAPRRVDRLVRAAAPETVPPLLLAAAGVALVAVSAFVAPMLIAGWHLQPLALAAACVPACLATRRVAEYLSG